MTTQAKQLRETVGSGIRLVSVRQLAAATSQSVRTIWRRVADGELPKPFKDGGRVVWRERDLERHYEKAAGGDRN